MVDTAIRHQLLKVFKDNYLLPLKHNFTRYLDIPTIGLIKHLYWNYEQMLATYLVANNLCLRDAYNLDKLLDNPMSARITQPQ